jgi:uncharacterized membrane protein
VFAPDRPAAHGSPGAVASSRSVAFRTRRGLAAWSVGNRPRWVIPPGERRRIGPVLTVGPAGTTVVTRWKETRVSQLIALGFQSETDADAFMTQVVGLEKAQLLGLGDMVKVVRKDDGKMKIKQSENLTGVGALSGAFWGMLIGFIFLNPFLGMAVGAAAGAVAGHFTDVGIDDDFIKSVGETIKPGQAGVFLLIQQETPDKVEDAMKEWQGKGVTVLKTNLSADAEAKLKETFGDA